ncbi:hypothetical protein JOB18_013841 [Solea senegalensis]|uniref:Shieldin complex subunit 3 n=1 Tax=Solea senegalensis TaxID=28829 RepID=A0AAV6QDB0_SOLSE|nr:shieldin complex subunit 3 [Solea senegalensis]KAG7489521.1 hypothetical protein JOB18_013841 [Solea senegalensis]
MEDVVLHYQPESTEELSSLLERTEKLLKPFPCRTSPVFTSWFPLTTSIHRLPIRPAKPAPLITVSDSPLVSHSRPCILTTLNTALAGNQLKNPEGDDCVAGTCHDHAHSVSPTSPPEKVKRREAACCVLENPNHHKPERGVTRLSPEKTPLQVKDDVTVTDSSVSCSWNVFTQRGILHRGSQSLSKQFEHMVSVHRLHLRQRAKWVIAEHNCGAAWDIEQVWRTLNRSVRSTGLPTCNANIQRDQAEIWVFCDILCSEQVGHFLKNELQLSGKIVLSVPRRGDVLSM